MTKLIKLRYLTIAVLFFMYSCVAVDKGGTRAIKKLGKLVDSRWNTSLWKRSHPRYINHHIIFVAEIINKAEISRTESERNYYRQKVKVLEIIRGELKSSVLIIYNINEKENPLKIGDKVVILGNWHKVGFYAIAVWSNSKKAQKLLYRIIDAKEKLN